ncbi:c-type cytochrome biogenesis protein CcsB [Plantibacter sp. M259]|uniref:c-type cytochrome biogenesis protein CcsB n=1 Tax=Plantibacter sp. M259 TaxID=2583822 RepID=UPI00111056F1|nr:c-type cytochrome biogenesis protein CcsB [Plantibacter sp. M259]
MTLVEISNLCLWSAVAVYALAFIAFTFDLARRSAEVTAAIDAAERAELERSAAAEERVGALASASARTVAPIVTNDGVPRKTRRPSDEPEQQASRKSPSLRVGVSLTVIAFLLHLVADVTRGIAAGRVPWANMYEFAMTGTLLIVAVFLVVIARVDLRFLGSFVIGLVTVLLGLATANFYVEVVPLPPALQSAWLVIHVFVASLGTAFFAIGFALSVVQLLQGRRERRLGLVQPSQGSGRLRFLLTLPNAERLENLAYRVNIIGFIFWTFTLMAGAIWAERAWGRYWGWDTKEVWTFIIWVIFAGYIHARATRGWRGSRAATLAIIGFSAVMFNFVVVNVFFKGLHAYSGL